MYSSADSSKLVSLPGPKIISRNISGNIRGYVKDVLTGQILLTPIYEFIGRSDFYLTIIIFFNS